MLYKYFTGFWNFYVNDYVRNWAYKKGVFGNVDSSGLAARRGSHSRSSPSDDRRLFFGCGTEFLTRKESKKFKTLFNETKARHKPRLCFDSAG